MAFKTMPYMQAVKMQRQMFADATNGKLSVGERTSAVKAWLEIQKVKKSMVRRPKEKPQPDATALQRFAPIGQD